MPNNQRKLTKADTNLIRKVLKEKAIELMKAKYSAEARPNKALSARINQLLLISCWKLKGK